MLVEKWLVFVKLGEWKFVYFWLCVLNIFCGFVSGGLGEKNLLLLIWVCKIVWLVGSCEIVGGGKFDL